VYHIKYRPEKGKELDLSFENGFLINTVQGATGYSVSLDLSQGVNQIGQDVRGMAVKGQNVSITGKILKGNTYAKKMLLRAFAPRSRGRLIFDDEFFLDVVVRDSPTITQEWNSVFGLRLFAEFPYWQRMNESRYGFSVSEKRFRFPVNYAEQHMFGETLRQNPFPITNSGDVSSLFTFSATAETHPASNIRITDKVSGKSLRFIGDLAVGDRLDFFWKNRDLYVQLNGENAFDRLDDESDLYEIPTGDSLIEIAGDEGIDFLIVSLGFREAFSGVLADGV
jgi:hypothetical protein